jgi:hypothetical protein
VSAQHLLRLSRSFTVAGSNGRWSKHHRRYLRKISSLLKPVSPLPRPCPLVKTPYHHAEEEEEWSCQRPLVSCPRSGTSS